MKQTQITFLLDRSNNWLEPYLLTSELMASHPSYVVTLSYDAEKVHNQDIVFILGYTKILNDDFLKQNTLNLVVHESNLPQGKGFAPVQWQILEGATRIPICLLEATHPVDSGDIVYRSHFELSGLELYEEIRQKQAQATLNIIKEFLNVYPHYIRQKQEGAETFYPKRGVKDGELDIHRSIYEQFNLLRIGNNEQWPSFFFYKGKKYILKIYSE